MVAGMPLAGAWLAAAADADALALLALRRWFASLTLSSPEATPRPWGACAWLLGLLVLWLVAAAAQGPVRALRQALDVPGLSRLLAAAVARLRGSGRVVAVLVGATVLSWTAGEAISFANQDRLAELVLLRKAKGLGELAFDQGALAALLPWRDVFGLGDVLVLTLAATAAAFRLSADRGGEVASSKGAPAGHPAAGATFWWCATGLYAAFRVVMQLSGGGGLLLGGCLVVEVAGVPLLMLLADGLLLGWVLAELRAAGLPEGSGAAEAITLAPGATLACLLALPARYLAAFVWLLWPYLPAELARPLLGVFLRGWGLVAVQAAAPALVGLAGVVAWTGGRPGAAIRGYGRLLRAEGGRLVALLGAAGLVAGVLSAAAYLILLSLPAQAWVLAAADSYAHYATLPVGLLTVSALVELGRRIPPEIPAPAEDLVAEPAGSVGEVA